MGNLSDLYNEVENLVFVAMENGATNTSDILGFVTQFIPKTLVSYELIDKIIEESNEQEEQ